MMFTPLDLHEETNVKRTPRIALWSFSLCLTLGLSVALPGIAQSDLVLVKSTNGQDANVAPGPVVVVGSAVTWTYEVTNAGGRDLENVAITDDQGVIVTCPATTLGAGESMICTGNGVAVAGQYTNLGTVNATGVGGGGAASASDPSHYFGQASVAVSIEKSTNGQDADLPPGPVVAVGAAISWTYVVTNVGSQPLINVAVSDDQGVVVTCPQTILAVGESMICTGAGVAQAGQYTNVGNVLAELPGGGIVAASDASHYFGQSLIADYGDAPDPTFPTTIGSLGAVHVLGSGVYLGACVDADLDGQPTADALGDDLAVGTATFGSCATVGDDEDGVTFGGLMVQGSGVSVNVVANEACTLSAWIDFNRDGDWNDPDDDLFAGGLVLSAGANLLAVNVPLAASAGTTFARFRCTTDGEVSATGRAEDGEVEDYAVTIQLRPAVGVSATKTAALGVDQNGNGQADPGDRLAYTVTITNGGPVAALTVIFTDTPDANTALLVGSVTTTLGTIATGNGPGDMTIGVDLGTLASGVSATIGFVVMIDDPLQNGVTSVSNQGLFIGANLVATPTDDPGVMGTQATVTPVVRTSVTEIPTLGGWGLLALALLVGGAGWWSVRQAPRAVRR